MPYDYSKVRSAPKVQNVKHPNRKKKKREEIKGVRVPHRKKRSAISKEDYQDVIDHHGELCWCCGGYPVQMHHTVFRSKLGRGGYRNILPLCDKHHQKAHRSYEFAESLRHEMRMKYGIHHSKDMYDLWKEGLITSPEPHKSEEFMRGEMEKCQRNVLNVK